MCIPGDSHSPFRTGVSDPVTTHTMSAPRTHSSADVAAVTLCSCGKLCRVARAPDADLVDLSNQSHRLEVATSLNAGAEDREDVRILTGQ